MFGLGGGSVASLFVELGADTTKAVSELGNFEKLMHNTAGTLGKVALGVGAAGIGALVGGIGLSIKAAAEAEEVQAQLGAVIKSTGGKAGVTADIANDLASSLQNVTKFEDDTIVATESMLLTFTNIGKDIFPQVTETALDMSQALGQDTKSSAIQLGKALNDPIQGVTALQRVGVSFTDSQKDQIKALVETGHLLEAQKMILAELNTEFGGAARAAGETFPGKLAILQNKLGDTAEKIGGAFLPVLSQVADNLITALDNPQVQAGLNNLVSGLTQIAKGDIAGGLANLGFSPTFISGLESAASAIGAIAGFLGGIKDQFNAEGGLDSLLAPMARDLGVLQQVLDNFNAGGLDAVIGGLAELGVPPAVLDAIQGIQTAFIDAATQGEVFLAWLDNAVSFLNDTIAAGLQNWADKYIVPIASAFDTVSTAIQGVIQWLKDLAALLGLDPGAAFRNALEGLGILKEPNGSSGFGFANGTDYAPGGMALVGERGPELVNLPRGSQVIPNHELGGINFYGSVTFLVPNMATWAGLGRTVRAKAAHAQT